MIIVPANAAGNITAFVNAFLNTGNLIKNEAEELIELIETHIRDKE